VALVAIAAFFGLSDALRDLLAELLADGFVERFVAAPLRILSGLALRILSLLRRAPAVDLLLDGFELGGLVMPEHGKVGAILLVFLIVRVSSAARVAKALRSAAWRVRIASAKSGP
jgi:hypothetical protein